MTVVLNLEQIIRHIQFLVIMGLVSKEVISAYRMIMQVC